MTANHELLNRITARPDVFGGKPIIRDMRVSVELVLSLLTQRVEVDDIRACTAYAHAIIAGDTLDSISVTESCGFS